MYTQCTHCQTIFELDEGTLQAAFGIVECGHCHRRFDALERLANELRDVATDAADRPRAAPAPRLVHSIEPPRASGTRRLHVKKVDLPADADLSAALIDATAKLEVDIRPEPATWREIELPVVPGAPGHLAPATEPATPLPAAAVTVPATPALATPTPAPTRHTGPAAPAAAAPLAATAGNAPPELPDTFELFAQLDAEANDASSTPRPPSTPVVDAAPVGAVTAADATTAASGVDAGDTAAAAAPASGGDPAATLAADLQAAPAAASGPVASTTPTAPAHYYVPPRRAVLGRELGWIAACLVLALLLASQIAVASRAQLYRNPATRNFAVSLCHAVGCDLPLLREPARLEWMSRDIRPLPSAPGALMITGTLRNTAAASQAYPVVVVQMTDIDGSVVAMRRFRPAEYMPSATTRAAGIAAGATVAVAFEVADPGRGAVSYQFGFE